MYARQAIEMEAPMASRWVGIPVYGADWQELDTEVWPVDTAEQTQAVAELLRLLEIAVVPVWVGDPGSPDPVKTDARIFAAEARETEVPRG